MKTRSLKWSFWAVVLAFLVIIVSWLMGLFDPSSKIRRVPANIPFNKEGSLLFIRSGGTDTLAVLDIEISKDAEEISRGLMYRNELKLHQGMLFIFPGSEIRNFWMKNTRFSLDIFFIDENQKIVNIVSNTTPFSKNSIPGTYPSAFVLETNAGYAERSGIKIGDFIIFTEN